MSRVFFFKRIELTNTIDPCKFTNPVEQKSVMITAMITSIQKTASDCGKQWMAYLNHKITKTLNMTATLEIRLLKDDFLELVPTNNQYYKIFKGNAMYIHIKLQANLAVLIISIE